MHAIHELKDRLCEELENVARSGKMDMSTLEKVDKIAGAAYHLTKLANAEDEYSERGSYRGGSYRGGSYRGSYDGGSYDGGSYDGYSSRRRDSMGRYARDGYSRDEDLTERLERLAGTGTDQERDFARKMLGDMRR